MDGSGDGSDEEQRHSYATFQYGNGGGCMRRPSYGGGWEGGRVIGEGVLGNRQER